MKKPNDELLVKLQKLEEENARLRKKNQQLGSALGGERSLRLSLQRQLALLPKKQ